MRILLFTLISLASSLALAATVYKWVDENGVVHYSDQPHPNAEKVHLKEPQTYKESGPLDTSAANPGSPHNASTLYKGCAVVQPSNNEDFSSVDSITVVVQTDPVLRGGDQVYVSLDGQPLNDGQPTGARFTISPVDRGSHTLQAAVKSSDGELLCQAPATTYNVHQPSVLNPANPLRHH